MTKSLEQNTKETGNDIDFGATKLLANIEHLTNWVITEAIETEKRPQTMNVRDDSTRLPAVWRVTLCSEQEHPSIRNTESGFRTHIYILKVVRRRVYKKHEAEIFLAEFNIDILLVSERFLHLGHRLSIWNRKRENEQGGGTAVIVKNDLDSAT